MSANNRDDIDPKDALRVVAQEYDRLLHDEEAEAKNAAARHTALKVMLTHRALLLKLFPADRLPPELDLGAARAAIAMEDPHDDDDEAGDPG